VKCEWVCVLFQDSTLAFLAIRSAAKKRQRVLQDGEEEAEERLQRKQYIVIRCMSMTPVAINICNTARTPFGLKLDLLQFTERGLEARGRLLYNH
jgi:hypothetical protein